MTTDKGGKVEFITNHKPSIQKGDYLITVKQVINANDITSGNEFSATLKFSVLGPRFTFDPQEIQAVFPPDGSLGDHANVFPHIILKRSTLPWERLAASSEPNIPWLALLLFDEGELSNETSQHADVPLEGGQHDDDRPSVIDVPYTLLKDIIPTGKDLQFLTHVRTTQDETGKPGEDELAVIICNRLPRPGAMSIAHLVSIEGLYEQTSDQTYVFNADGAQSGDSIRLVSLTSWRFACIDKRQGFKGLLMHLNQQLLFSIKDDGIGISLNQDKIPEQLKQAFAHNQHPLNASIQVDHVQWKITDNSLCYFISNTFNVYSQAGRHLFKLDAAAVNSNQLEQLLDKFKQSSHILSESAAMSTIAVPDHWWLNKDEYLIAQEQKRLYVYHLDPDNSCTLRLPPLNSSDQPTATNAAESYLKMGCVPLSHFMREGNKSVSWYHSPLVPGDYPQQDIPLPVRSSDDLVRYNPDYGMFDVSYAAAWELGRLLALQSKSFSVGLYHWKRTHAQKIKDAERQLDHLPLDGPSPSLELPQAVSSWFKHLALLEGVPFNYLVPDERLLPPESIRFFRIDPMWMECLMDGAFSIGRVLATDHEQDRSHRKDNADKSHSTEQITNFLNSTKTMSGFLLRSDVVAGWPGLLVDGYSEVVSDAIPGLNDGASFRQDLDGNDSLNGKVVKKLQLLRMASLSKNVLVCLFDGIVDAIDLYLKPEALHFGLQPDDRIATSCVNNRAANPASLLSDSSLWRQQSKRVLNIAELAKRKQSDNSAQFALRMIASVEKVRYTLSSDNLRDVDTH